MPARQQQRVRIHFLVALTLVVALFGVSQSLRTCRRTKEWTHYVAVERELRDYMATLLAQQEELEDFAQARRGIVQRDAVALLMQLRYLIERSRGTLPESAPPIQVDFENLRANFARLRAGQAVQMPVDAPFLRGYYAPADGSYQPYGIAVPSGYRPTRPMPLIITLDDNTGQAPFQCAGAPVYAGAISVKPHGRGATDFMYLGEDDVLAVLDDVSRLYAIDRSRVYFVGRASGATGCWNLAAHYPDLFAGLVACAGSTDHRVWQRRWAENSTAAHQSLRDFIMASLSPAFYAENLMHTHVFAIHSMADEVVPVDHSRSMIDALRRLGYSPDYLEFPQAAHGACPQDAEQMALAKVLGQPPAGQPSTIRYRTANWRHDGAWWLRVDRLGHPARFTRVEAAATSDGLKVVTENAFGLTLRLGELPFPVGSLSIDGVELPLEGRPGPAGWVSVEKWNGQWRLAQPPAGLAKRKGLSGPFGDILRDPFLVVYGTSSRPDLMNLICRQEAERFASQWTARYGAAPRLAADRNVTPRDMEQYNLLLFGGPQENIVTRQIAPYLPIALADGAVNVGAQRYTGNDLGVIFCYPNPASLNRMVGIVAGATPAAMFQAYDRFGLWPTWSAYEAYKWFDYAVFDNRTAGPESFLCVGFFDNLWRLPGPEPSPAGGGAEWKADPASQAALVPQKFPTLARAAESSERKVYLSDVMPGRIEQCRGAVGWDRTCGGEAIRLGDKEFKKGFGVRPPSSISFALDGQFEHFEATVGLTRGAQEAFASAWAEQEEVVFEVLGDGRRLCQSAPLSRREGAPSSQRLYAPVRDISTLTLVARPHRGQSWFVGSCAWGDPLVRR